MKQQAPEDLTGCLGLCLLALAFVFGIASHVFWSWLVR